MSIKNQKDGEGQIKKEEHHNLREYYNNVYYKDAQRVAVPTAHHRQLLKKLGIKKGYHVLDVACGTGEWLKAVEESGAIPSGIDVSEKAIQICKNNIPDGDFRVGIAEGLPFKDNHFDVITCFGSLEHFVDPELALFEMRRVSRDKALFLLLVPNSGFLTRRLGLFSGTDQVQVKEDVRTLEEWGSLFQRSGFVVEKKWRDLHILSKNWILRKPWVFVPLRMLQALALLLWPLSWQYQVYFLCR